MTKTHRDDDLGEPGGGERYLPPEAERRVPPQSLAKQLQTVEAILRNFDLQGRADVVEEAASRLEILEVNCRLAADLMRQDSNASADEAEQKLRRALAATGYLYKSEAPE